jgi:hypothetical protein
VVYKEIDGEKAILEEGREGESLSHILALESLMSINYRC